MTLSWASLALLKMKEEKSIGLYVNYFFISGYYSVFSACLLRRSITKANHGVMK